MVNSFPIILKQSNNISGLFFFAFLVFFFQRKRKLHYYLS